MSDPQDSLVLVAEKPPGTVIASHTCRPAPDPDTPEFNECARDFIQKVKEALALVLAAVLIGLTGPGCSTLRDAPRAAEMADAEYAAWQARAVAQIGAIADVALAEGDLSPDAAYALADLLDAMSMQAAGSAWTLTSALKLDTGGYGGLALTLALTELDAEMARQGLIVDGLASERGRSFFLSLSERLRASLPAKE